jgi:hypothetical protein
LKHGGDWNVSQHYGLVDKLCARLTASGFNMTAGQPIAPSDAGAPQDAVLCATGRVDISLLDAEKEALKKRLAAGGFLLVDAAMGDQRFQQAFNKFAEEMGWVVKRFDKDSDVLKGAMRGGLGHDLTKGIKFTQTAFATAGAPLATDLRGLYAGERLVGIYSPLDLMYAQASLRAWGALGYDGPSAQSVVDNIMICVLSAQPVGGAQEPAPALPAVEPPPAQPAPPPTSPEQSQPAPSEPVPAAPPP